MKNRVLISKIAKIAVISALAGAINLFTVPLPFFPPFYEMDFSDVVVLIGGFHLGPWAVLVIETIKQLINLSVNGTITAFVGEIANLLMGVAFVFPAAFFYQKRKTFSGALMGLGIGLVSLAVVSAALNYFALIPIYAKAFGMDAVMNMAKGAIPAISDLKTLILFATVPFNLFKGAICAVLTVLLYKRVSPFLKKW
jgi:riboflavin transporter FmnP